MKNKWSQQNNDFYLSEVSQQTDKLTPGVYKINFNERLGTCFLSKTSECFTFPYKVYGQETKFVQRVVKTYEHTTSNLGILLNGLKGTGKTVTAQQICNALNLPILIVHSPYDQLSSFINELQQDVVIFFDEYEKMYRDYDTSVLTVMDGVLNNEYRKTFILTTNELYLNKNMLQRPGRLRYIKTFTDLSLETIKEIVNDKLVHKQFTEELLSFISKLEIITIDIVKSLVEEVNIHEETPENFRSIFNIKSLTGKVNVFENVVGEGFVKPCYSEVIISPVKFTQETIGDNFYVNNKCIGEITTVLAENVIVVNLDDPKAGEEEFKTFKTEEVDFIHHSFSKFTF